jgi:hypothetical protein
MKEGIAQAERLVEHLRAQEAEARARIQQMEKHMAQAAAHLDYIIKNADEMWDARDEARQARALLTTSTLGSAEGSITTPPRAKRTRLPAPTECPTCKRSGCYAKPEQDSYYCPHCWNLFGKVFADP